MDLVSRRAELLNRQVIDTDQDETALNEPASCIAGQSHKVGMELVVVPESAVRRLQEKACCLGRHCSGLEVTAVMWRRSASSMTCTGPKSASIGIASTVERSSRK